MTSRTLFPALLFLSLAVLPVGTIEPGGCEPDGNVRFICGVPSPEDLVPVPRSDWVVASGYIRGGVHLVNTRTYSTTQVFPAATPRERFDSKRYGACPDRSIPGKRKS